MALCSSNRCCSYCDPFIFASRRTPASISPGSEHRTGHTGFRHLDWPGSILARVPGPLVIPQFPDRWKCGTGGQGDGDYHPLPRPRLRAGRAGCGGTVLARVAHAQAHSSRLRARPAGHLLDGGVLDHRCAVRLRARTVLGGRNCCRRCLQLVADADA